MEIVLDYLPAHAKISVQVLIHMPNIVIPYLEMQYTIFLNMIHEQIERILCKYKVQVSLFDYLTLNNICILLGLVGRLI
jgi:hypothetical protein